MKQILLLHRTTKQLVVVSLDLLGMLLVPLLAIWVRHGNINFPTIPYLEAISVFPVICIPIFLFQGIYRSATRYLGYRFFQNAIIAITIAVVAWASLLFMMKFQFPRSGIIITWMLALLFVIGSRVFARLILNTSIFKNTPRPTRNVLIFGAGESGKQLANAMKRIRSTRIVGFIDDDPQYKRVYIDSINVYSRHDLKGLIAGEDITHVYLAIPSASISKRREVLQWLEAFPVKVLTLPGVEELLDGKINATDIREVDITDLLGRDPVPPLQHLLQRCVTERSVMVTGAGGSIGSEICRSVLKLSPKCLVLFEMSEFALYSIEQELKKIPFRKDVKIISILGSVLDKEKLKILITKFNIDTIYHAAAYKHVPIVEHNIREGVINNTFGTLTCAEAAAETGVKHFVLISTDKAVRPTNFMGASKRLAEMVLQAMQDVHPNTRFTMVRFGNVLGSSGSVIPLFRKQIKEGGPVTVTHPEITRYFMTIPEAASLVIQAGAMGEGGDVFVLDMGNPVKIYDLAQKVIRFSGFTIKDNENNDGDIAIEFTGLRPGEKLYEELLIGDNGISTEHPRIMRAEEDYIPISLLSSKLNLLKKSLDQYDIHKARVSMEDLVEDFQHNKKIVDNLKQEGSVENIVRIA